MFILRNGRDASPQSRSPLREDFPPVGTSRPGLAGSARGAYVNFLMDEGQDRVKAAYRGNYNRLAQVKERYDPDNTFRINQNIQPAGGPNP